MGWNTGSMVRRPPNPLDIQQRRTIQQLSGTMASEGTPVYPSMGGRNMGYDPSKISLTAQDWANSAKRFGAMYGGQSQGMQGVDTTFGSGITMPPASPSSQAIAGFVNLRGGQTPMQPPQVPQVPQPSVPYNPAPRGGGTLNTGNQQRANWWNAVNAAGQPSSSIAQTQPTNHADYVQKTNAILDYARQQGLPDTDINAFGQRLNYQGLNTYAGGDPAGAYAQWQREQEQAKAAMVAQAAAGSTNWVSGG